ncbi:MAG: tripartite tricarboxylate transporter substrate binding protein [Deltaproteobacteria bacterium]|nr:tripartite tricarboxylate transporter substrate binding protein [Deltaproteobacteria bacterium]
MRRSAVGTLAALAALSGPVLPSHSGHAADFPKKPIKLIVTAAAGGGEDSEARAIAPFVEKYLGTQVQIENQPGAGGKIAFEKFQKAEPDGYTLITYTFPKSIIIEHQGKTNFRTKDFTPIFAWSRSSQLLVVNADTWKTFDEFRKAAKAKPLAGGLSGRGSTTHLVGLIAMDELDLKPNWVPYEGSAGSVTALAGKHLDFTICLAASAASLVQAGKLRPLLLFADKRDPYLPDVPIPKEVGLDMTYLPSLRGVEAPPNTPAAVIKILEEAFSKAAKDPGFLEIAKKKQVIVHPVSSQEFAKAVADAYPKIQKFEAMLKE